MTRSASSVFNDAMLSVSLGLADSDWLERSDLTVGTVVRRMFGPHTTVVEYPYTETITAFVASCMATHRAFLIDSTDWANSPTAEHRTELAATAFTRYDEGANLLTVAATFTEPGYRDRRDSNSCTPADRFVLALARRWFESRAAVGDVWDPAGAAVFASLVQASAVVPYLSEVVGFGDTHRAA